MIEDRKSVRTLTWDLVAPASKHYNKPIRQPVILFDLRGKTAGTAARDGSRIRINADLLARYPNEMTTQTVPHEVAHIVAHAVFGHRIRPHGREWKSIMGFFGCKADRCHTMETVPARKTKQYEVACACSTHQIGAIRYRRMVTEAKVYTCKACKKPVLPTDPAWCGFYL